MHEYTVINHPRHKILFYLALISVGVTSILSLLFNKVIPFILPTFMLSFSVSIFTVFLILYWLFNNCFWKNKFFSKTMKFPNLAGKWDCDAISNNIALQQEFPWKGSITITQSWDKILIILKTTTSTSESKSVVGGINYVEGKGYEVSYHYNNTPNIAESELKKHEGFCVLCFSEDLKTAEGYYFNNIKERTSYGVMKLRKEAAE